MKKLIHFKIEEAANFFCNSRRTENETYLLNIILDLGKEYNLLIGEYNELAYRNENLKKMILRK